jgi:hypothetical protein
MIRVPLLDARGVSGDRVLSDGVGAEEVGAGDEKTCEVRVGAGSGSSTVSEVGDAHAPTRRQTRTARHLMTPSVRHEVRRGEGLSAEAGNRASR